MRHTTLRYTEAVEELATFWVVVSSAAESVLECSPGNTTYTEVVNEFVAEFQRVEVCRSKLEWPAARI
jgi:hypothetical protein